MHSVTFAAVTMTRASALTWSRDSRMLAGCSGFSRRLTLAFVIPPQVASSVAGAVKYLPMFLPATGGFYRATHA